MPKKIKKTKSRGMGLSDISPSQVAPKGISFSFKYLKTDHDKFKWIDREINYLITLLDRLKSVSNLTAIEMIQNGSNALRCHSIEWDDTREQCFGIPSEDQLVDKPCQFSLLSNAHGRVHGFFINEIFYVVWLDPKHLLYNLK